MFSRKEVGAFFICAVVLTIIFGFNDGAETFIFLNWFNNMLMVLFVVLICMVVYVFAQKVAAKSFNAFTVFKVWKISRFRVAHKKLNLKNKEAVPLGILVGILLALLSFGKAFWTGIWSNDVDYKSHKRVGRDKIVITEYETAKIIFAGPAALIVFSVILTWFLNAGYNVEFVRNVAFLIGFINMIPLPGMDGSRVFFSSKMMWVFGAIFMFLSFGLRYLGVFGNIIMSTIAALMLLAIYYYRWE